MFPYADYSFYKNQAYGKMDEREFGEASIEASSIVRRITFGRSDIMQPEELRYATCAIADMCSAERCKSKNGIKKSENNDGYSVAYVSEADEGEAFEELLLRKSITIARNYLLSTGLLSRKVREPC